jgi:chromosome partitioning protein
MTHILAIFNQKGGVGKTTTAVNLAAGLALAGERTLLCDLDPQGNATTGLGVVKSALKASIYDLLLGEGGWEGSAVPTGVPGLDIVPATLDLAGAVVELATAPRREWRLREGLAGAEATYSYIILDTPPSLGLIPVNCLAVANGVIIPMQPEFFALEGLAQIEHTVRLARRSMNPALEITGVLLTMVDLRARLFSDVIRTVRRQYGEKVFHAQIPRTVRFAEAPSYGEPILTFDPRGKGARAYHELTKEVLERCHPDAAA